jgi:hypothetical protein
MAPSIAHWIAHRLSHRGLSHRGLSHRGLAYRPVRALSRIAVIALAAALPVTEVPVAAEARPAIVLVKHYKTKITGIKVTPSSVPAGGLATISGRLWNALPGHPWLPFGGQQVVLIYRIVGTRTWYELGTAKSRSSGRFSYGFADYASAFLEAVFLGDRRHLWCESTTVKITVSR